MICSVVSLILELPACSLLNRVQSRRLRWDFPVQGPAVDMCGYGKSTALVVQATLQACAFNMNRIGEPSLIL
jgi:hypothetical protein